MFLFTPKVPPAVISFLTLEGALGGAVVFGADGALEVGADVSIMASLS